MARPLGGAEERITGYLAEVRRLPRLSREEEHATALRARDGDAEARQRLVQHNLQLVPRVIARFIRGSLRLDDLVQEGNLGLLRALETFDPEAGTRFATYAIWWIRAYVGKQVKEGRSLVRPRGGTVASADLSLDGCVEGEEDTTHLERIEDGRPGAERELLSQETDQQTRETLNRFRHRIGPLGWDIIQSRLQVDEPHSLEALGKRWGLSRECVRQAELRTKRLLARCLAERAAA